MTWAPRALCFGPCSRDYSDIGRPPSGPLPQAIDPVNPICHYVIVRANLSRGEQAAQIVHAACESVLGPHEPGTFVVVLSARDELHLTLIASDLERRGIAFVRVHEPDAPHNGALVALGLRPARKENVRRAVSSLPLLR